MGKIQNPWIKISPWWEGCKFLVLPKVIKEDVINSKTVWAVDTAFTNSIRNPSMKI